jgi:hypothetical protein
MIRVESHLLTGSIKAVIVGRFDIAEKGSLGFLLVPMGRAALRDLGTPNTSTARSSVS